MEYKKFIIENYRAINGKIEIDLSRRITPLVGINECGKTTILKAMLCFDWTNDSDNDSEHLNTVNNLYKTIQAGPPKISAIINCPEKKFKFACDNIIKASTKLKGTDKWDDSLQVEIDEISKFSTPQEEITISRVLEAKNRHYTSPQLKALTPSSQDKICRELVSRTPYILYNDDFTDRPEEIIKISTDSEDTSAWQDIFENVFSSTNNEYSLIGTLNESDERVRNSILSDVTTFLDNALTTIWSRFSPQKVKIKTRLSLDCIGKTLKVFIVEETKNGNRDFFITNRSKGFIWYYNFIMKIRFNPKRMGAQKGTIFLLDEPGSYLHEKAQEELCKKLKDISETEGIVIYCTHSPRLLNPDIIPINTIKIVEKKGPNIKITPLAQTKTIVKNNAALQPIYEALQLPEYEQISKDEKVLCVEGIYDKYAIECFCNLPKFIRIFPSTCAEAILNNISFFLAYQKEYLALWDNDSEGEKVMGKAKSVFGVHESVHFALLPKMGKSKMRMEEMIEFDDYTILKKLLTLPPEAHYESIISELFFSKNKASITKNVSDKTKDNFSVLEKLISKRLIDKS